MATQYLTVYNYSECTVETYKLNIMWDTEDFLSSIYDNPDALGWHWHDEPAVVYEEPLMTCDDLVKLKCKLLLGNNKK